MTSASSWASAARGWISSRKSEPCVEARRRRCASGLFRATGVLAGCVAGVSAGCATGVLAGCGTGVPGAVGPARSPALLPVFSVGCATGVPGAVGPARPLTVRAASFARRVGSKPGQALRPRRRPPLWWLVVRVDWSGPLHLQPSHASIAGHSTNFACNSLVTISNREFATLELQRFLTWLNLRPIELHATFGGGLAVRRRPPRW